MLEMQLVSRSLSKIKAARRRAGVSLVEMLVAVALVLFIMVILSEAFRAGLESFRLLKGVGDMQVRLRTATGVLRSDLTSDHFIEAGPRLSDQDLSTQAPPSWGFFRIWQGSKAAGAASPLPN